MTTTACPTSAIPATASWPTCPCRRRSSTSSPGWPRTSTRATRPRVGDECVFARVQSKSSGGAAQLLASGWDEETEGPRPVIWSPAASTLGDDPQPAPRRRQRAADDRRLRVLPADPARDRHAAPDGRGARLAGGAARLRRHPRPVPGSGRAGPGRGTRSGASSGWARPTRTSPPAGSPRSSRRHTPPTARRPGSPSRTSPRPPPTTSPARSSPPSSTTATRP